MAVRGFFYNSVNGDRKYNGIDMNEDKAPFYNYLLQRVIIKIKHLLG